MNNFLLLMHTTHHCNCRNCPSCGCTNWWGRAGKLSKYQLDPSNIFQDLLEEMAVRELEVSVKEVLGVLVQEVLGVPAAQEALEARHWM